MMKYVQKHSYFFLFLGITILILGGMLRPGYILTLDMVFTDRIPFSINPNDLHNALPLNYMLHMLSLIVPGWIVQKIMLVTLFMTLLCVSFRYLPVSNDARVKVFAALLYTVNPFVYTRLLAGQWTILIAYALLPLFVHYLFKTGEKVKNIRDLYKLAFVVLLISIFSLHFFVMTIVIMGLWIMHSILLLGLDPKANAYPTNYFLKHILFATAAFLIISSYWIIPAMHRTHPIESRFDLSHVSAFSASANTISHTPTILNIASLHGFWGEGTVWARYFAWPQTSTLFWIACMCLMFLVLLSVYKQFKHNSRQRFIVTLALLSFVFALGASNTPFNSINLWLYAHVPFWNGFRDSQKWVGVLALCYVLLASCGLRFVYDFFSEKNTSTYAGSTTVLIASLFIPLLFGMHMWGGYAEQLRAVWYPESWYTAKDILEHPQSKLIDTPEYTLALPWQGYMSYAFNNNLILANPSVGFFGPNTVVSRNVRLGTVYDQENDASYSEFDQVLRRGFVPDGTAVHMYLYERGITHILFFQDLVHTDPNKYLFLQDPHFVQTYADSAVLLYTVTP